MSYLLIGIGGAIGAICRYSLGLAVMRNYKGHFPRGTWIINLTGSFLLGLLFNLHTQGFIQDWALSLFGVGFCGAYTTFSTFGNEAVQLILANKLKLAAGYVVTSVLLSLLAAWVGWVV
jgi:fluoride exporter